MYNTLTLNLNELPKRLQQVPQPPNQLFCQGGDLHHILKQPAVAIVGTRGISPYGRQVTLELSSKLAARGIVIISGLALGVDAVAHQAALDAGGTTIAVLPSPLDNVLPGTNRRLAQRILDSGGILVSEYALGSVPYRKNFLERNRIVSGLADGLLITEAASRSGTKATYNLAQDQGREIMVVPGNITSRQSEGANNMLKQGAHLITSYHDVLSVLKLHDTKHHMAVKGSNPHEQAILNLLLSGISDGETLLTESKLTASNYNRALTMLEIDGKVRPLGANHWAIH